MALGNTLGVSDSYTLALGYNSNATAMFASTIGNDNTAGGVASVAIGNVVTTP